MRIGTKAQSLIAVVVTATACTTVRTYPGPARPSDETAIVETTGGLVVMRVDRRKILRGDRFEILPGTHVFVVRRDERKLVGILPGGVIYRRKRSLPVDVCIKAKRKRLYLIQPKEEGDDWAPVVLDGETMAPPATPCGPDEDDDDLPPRQADARDR